MIGIIVGALILHRAVVFGSFGVAINGFLQLFSGLFIGKFSLRRRSLDAGDVFVGWLLAFIGILFGLILMYDGFRPPAISLTMGWLGTLLVVTCTVVGVLVRRLPKEHDGSPRPGPDVTPGSVHHRSNGLPAPDRLGSVRVRRIEAPLRTTKLYTIIQIRGAAFFGGPLAGCALMASNFRELGSKKGYRGSIIGGLCVVAIMALFAYYLPELPDGFPKHLIALGIALSIGQVASSLQGEAISTHIAGGGMKQSGWKATGLTLAWLIATLGVFIAVIVAADL